MSIENWGLLTKSQTDPETIEEAINRIVGEHEAEPTAHLGEGESLEAHRTNDIIDHLAGSIPFDKTTPYELSYKNYFISPSTYDGDGNIFQSGGGEIYLYDYHVANAESNVYIPIPSFQNGSFPEKDITVQFVLKLNFANNSDTLDVMFGTDENGFGLTVRDSVLKGSLYIDNTRYLTNALTFTKNQIFLVRIFISSADNACFFFINGVQVASLALAPKGAPDFGQLALLTTSTSTTFALLSLSNLEMSYHLDLVP
jgi:hypothetical protein